MSMSTGKGNDRRLYRLVRLAAIVVGAALLLGGSIFSRPAVAITGGIIALVHGIIAQIMLAAEGRREPVLRAA